MASQMGAKIPDSIAGLAALDENEYNNTVLPVITPFIEAVAPDQAAAFSYANICALQKGYMDIERRLPEIETDVYKRQTHRCSDPPAWRLRACTRGRFFRAGTRGCHRSSH